MSESCAVGTLFDGALDIIGDIHGELGALECLLKKLGYDDLGRHRDGRRLVFVGDLVDRGKDSPGVLRTVMRMLKAGNAQCIVGNHELNALRDDPEEGRHGEGWWYGRDESPYHSECVSDVEKEKNFLPFLRKLPAALERKDLRVVHACWHEESIESLRSSETVIDHYYAQEQAGAERLREMEVAAGRERRELAPDGLGDSEKKVPFLEKLAEYDTAYQMGNAARVVTSGVERPAEDCFYSSGKWRMVERVKWWDEYDETPVIFGHYWRRYRADSKSDEEESAMNLFAKVQPADWLGPDGAVMCIDYSVGNRFKERQLGTEEGAFWGCLAALRVPGWELIFDDGRPTFSIGEPRSLRSR